MATTATVAPPSDNLNPPPTPTRVNYVLGRMLGAEDLQADQDYHRGCLARALLQLCGTGTVSGLLVSTPQFWQANTYYPAWSFVYDANQNVQVNTGLAGVSGSGQPKFATNPGGTVSDSGGIVWTNEGSIIAETSGTGNIWSGGSISLKQWMPNAPFPFPSAIVDSNNNVQILNGPPLWQSQTSYAAWAFIYDSKGNVQVNTGAAGTSGSTQPIFATTLGGSIPDGPNIVWTCEGPLSSNGWAPNTVFTAPTAIVDSNGNVQILTAKSPFTSGNISPRWNSVVGDTTQDGSPAVAAWTCAGPQNVQVLTTGSSVFTAGTIPPVWSTAIGSTTQDGQSPVTAWTCVGPWQPEISVTSGLAIDRVGRMIEVPSTLCIRIQPWLANQSASDLNSFLTSGSGNILVDVFATFVPCTQGLTPCFATQDDYDATDAFSSNRLLDSFAMQLVLRTDTNPQLPQDPWLAAGAIPTGPITTSITQALQRSILSANSGPAANLPFAANGSPPAEIPPNFDPSSVFLARISIPATATTPGQLPNYNLNGISVNNYSRLFLYPPSLVARAIGLSSGSE